MSPIRYVPQGLPLRAFEIERLRRLLHERGVRWLCEAAEINRGTLSRALAELGLYPATLERIRAALATGDGAKP